MKITFPHFLLATAGLTSLIWLLPLGAQTVPVTDELLSLVQSIAVQQKLIDTNQASIDKSLAVVQENMRQAKIYINRAGGGKAAK